MLASPASPQERVENPVLGEPPPALQAQHARVMAATAALRKTLGLDSDEESAAVLHEFAAALRADATAAPPAASPTQLSHHDVDALAA